MKVIRSKKEKALRFSDLQAGQTFQVLGGEIIAMKIKGLISTSGSQANAVSLEGGHVYNIPTDKPVILVEGAFVLGAE